MDRMIINELIARMAVIFIILLIVIIVLRIYLAFIMWRIFKKANKPGWIALIPFYNSYTITEITWGNGWLFLIMALGGVQIFTKSIPDSIALILDLISFAFIVMTKIKLAKAFGKDDGFAAGLVFLGIIFMSILAFDSSDYLGVPGKGINITPPDSNINNAQNQIQREQVNTFPQQQSIGSVYPQQTVTNQAQPTNEVGNHCPKCGVQLQSETKFCQNCGTKITN